MHNGAGTKDKISKGGRILPALCKLFGIVIILLVIAFCLSLLLPKVFGYQVYTVLTGSMEPAIPTGSLIYAEELEPEKVEPGDVIVFEQDGSVVAHRVKENRFVEGEFITKGDANAAEDLFTVRYSDLLGRVKMHIPRLGAFSMIYTSVIGKVYLLLFALCGVLFNVLGERLKSRGQIRQQPELPGKDTDDREDRQPSADQ
jgi:signal peptidase I